MPDAGARLAYVEANAERFVDELRAACRIPSVSAIGGPAMTEMAEWLRQRLSAVLDETRLIDVPESFPAVYGELKGASRRNRLLLYSHYDVQPVDPVSEWTHDPFAAEIRDGAVVARGVADDKADVMARIHALETWRQTSGRLPFTLRWLSEGAEEVGSRGLRQLLQSQRDSLAADGCLWESYLRRMDGTPEIGFGCRGLLYVELKLRVLAGDQHSSFRSVFRSAAAELARALASLTDESGLVTIDGFHDDIIEPDDQALAALQTAAPPPATAVDGSTPYVSDDPTELKRRLLFEPTANIAGLWAGHTAEGAKTVLPAAAHAKLDFRLVPDQDPQDIAAKLRRHLDAHGFDAVEITVLHSSKPARSPMDGRLARSVVVAAEDVMAPAATLPYVAGSGPVSILRETLDMPVVMPPGATRPDSNIHAPNEQCRISDYLDLVRFNLRLFELMAEGEPPTTGGTSDRRS